MVRKASPSARVLITTGAVFAVASGACAIPFLLLLLSSFEGFVARGVGQACLLGAGNTGACLQNEVTTVEAERLCELLRVATPHDDLHVTPKAAARKARQGRGLIDGIAQLAGHILLLQRALYFVGAIRKISEIHAVCREL